MATYQLVDVDLTTVLFDLNDPTGAANSSWGSTATKFGLDGALDVRAPLEAARFEPPELDGAFTLQTRRALGTAVWKQFLSASSEANLRLGVGRLVDLATRGGILKIVTGTTRYLRFEPSEYPQPLDGHDLNLYDAFTAFKFQDGLRVSLACQPWWEGADVTIGPTNIPNDPASTNGRALSVSISGDLPVPVKAKVKMDTGSTVQRVHLAHHTSKGGRTVASLADYAGATNPTRFMQCEATSGGWTITLGTDTSATTDANASPGSSNTIARCTYATVASMVRRVRGTRTTLLDSLRGSWDVWVRCKASAVSRHVMQLGWGPSTADPAVFLNTEVVHQQDAGTTTFGYIEKNLGPIYIPEDPAVPIGGLALEVWSRLESGSGNLDMDFLWLVSRDGQGTVYVVGGTSQEWTGAQMVTPPYKRAADPTWVAGTLQANGQIQLNAVNEGAGTPPNAGQVWGTGRHTALFDTGNHLFTGTVKHRVVNVTDDTVVVESVEVVVNNYPQGATLSFNGVAAKAYQLQTVITAYTSGAVNVRTFAKSTEPTLALNESVRTDPSISRYAVDRLDTSGNLAGYMGVEGEVPMVLWPGTNIVALREEELRLVGYSEGETIRTRTPALTLTYAPRYSF